MHLNHVSGPTCKTCPVSNNNLLKKYLQFVYRTLIQIWNVSGNTKEPSFSNSYWAPPKLCGSNETPMVFDIVSQWPFNALLLSTKHLFPHVLSPEPQQEQKILSLLWGGWVLRRKKQNKTPILILLSLQRIPHLFCFQTAMTDLVRVLNCSSCIPMWRKLASLQVTKQEALCGA